MFLFLLLRKISHPIDDLRLCQPVLQIKVELLTAEQLLVGKSQREARKEEEGPRRAINMVLKQENVCSKANLESKPCGHGWGAGARVLSTGGEATTCWRFS